jgi:hypothetical protein
MPKFECTIPIVGYAYVEVEADNKQVAQERALSIPWEDLDIIEEYTTDKVCEGNVCYHPYSRIDIVEK